jgi:nucleotide-binding universal stress UspA family protein
LRRTLLAYDGSPKAKEALFVATYLAERWTTPVVVVSVPESRHDADKAIREAQDYLKRGDAEATFVQARGPAGDAILRTAADHGCDLILMGGYGHSPVVEVIVGSTVDQVLRESQCPILVCR